MASAASPLFRRFVATKAKLILASKTSGPLRNVNVVAVKNLSTTNVALSGIKGFTYRTAHPAPAGFVGVIPDLVLGFVWWWIFWNLFTEPGHVFGDFPDINPAKFTDEELGIPPDDE